MGKEVSYINLFNNRWKNAQRANQMKNGSYGHQGAPTMCQPLRHGRISSAHMAGCHLAWAYILQTHTYLAAQRDGEVQEHKPYFATRSF
ncbi:unnamed protein product [Gulo gulo]|uniref:Uncharacterized protein n=1 Tax=Gulo gulo TaxID=48420 RepID=A0A9X9MBL7_GULGU|nr:unnamed protein product [Gulo gulo]